MTAVDRLLKVLDARGLAVRPGAAPGQLVLTGPDAEKTPDVLGAVRAFKPQLLDRFGTAPTPVTQTLPPAGKLPAPPVPPEPPAEQQAPLPPTPGGSAEFPFPAPEPAPVQPVTPPGEDPWGNLVHRSGTAAPVRAAELVGSDRATCAYVRVKLVPGESYPWEEWQPRERDKYPATHFRVQHPAAVVPVTRAAFADLFPGADA